MENNRKPNIKVTAFGTTEERFSEPKEATITYSNVAGELYSIQFRFDKEGISVSLTGDFTEPAEPTKEYLHGYTVFAERQVTLEDVVALLLSDASQRGCKEKIVPWLSLDGTT